MNANLKIALVVLGGVASGLMVSGAIAGHQDSTAAS